MRAAQGSGKLANDLLQAQQRGELQGIYGRLGDLGTIDDKYDVAVSTAATKLDWILVDNFNNSKAVLAYVKRHQLGRVKMVLLERQVGVWDQKMALRATPESCPRLFDLIKPNDPMFRPAFYHICRDTIVAEDVDQANRVAYGKERFRVVTINGELFETYGAMSGGGKNKKKGKMSSKQVECGITEEMCQAVEGEAREANAQLKKVKSELKTLDKSLKQIQKNLQNSKSTLQRKTDDV